MGRWFPDINSCHPQELWNKFLLCLSAVNDNLEATAQAVYKKMFVTDVDNTALPEGWRIVPLESISELSAGGDKPSAYSDIQSETCNVPIFSNGIEQEGLYGFTDKAKISDESVTVSAR